MLFVFIGIYTNGFIEPETKLICLCLHIDVWCLFRKYPSILSDEERDQYKAVFNDQYAEYRELHAEVQIMAKKFEEMDEMMQNLPSRPSSQMVHLPLSHLHTKLDIDRMLLPINPFIFFQEKERISSILSEYERKKAVSTCKNWDLQPIRCPTYYDQVFSRSNIFVAPIHNKYHLRGHNKTNKDLIELINVNISIVYKPYLAATSYAFYSLIK